MLFARDYQRPFWRGFFHAVLVASYTIFLSIVVLSLNLLFGGSIGVVIRWAFYFFLAVLSFAVCGYLIFYEPMKKILHQHFKAGTVMMVSTIGWLFVFKIIFLVGLVMTVGYY